MAKKNKEKTKPVPAPPPERNCVYLTYDESKWGGDVCAGQENDPWPNHEDENIEWSLRECFKTPDTSRWLSESVDIDFEAKVAEEVHVVYVRYSTGGTFGRTNGAWTIIGVYEHEGQADKVKKSIEDDTYAGHKCWKGYFESFESCDIETMRVKP